MGAINSLSRFLVLLMIRSFRNIFLTSLSFISQSLGKGHFTSTGRSFHYLDSKRVIACDLEQYQAYQYSQGRRIKRRDYVCTHAFCFPGVFTDGRVAPCDQDFNATQAYGRMGNGVSFSDLWFGKRAAAARKVIRDARETFSFCANCPFADHLSNTCSFRLLWPNTNKSRASVATCW